MVWSSEMHFACAFVCCGVSGRQFLEFYSGFDSECGCGSGKSCKYGAGGLNYVILVFLALGCNSSGAKFIDENSGCL